jgi:hypothetical protein
MKQDFIQSYKQKGVKNKPIRSLGKVRRSAPFKKGKDLFRKG